MVCLLCSEGFLWESRELRLKNLVLNSVNGSEITNSVFLKTENVRSVLYGIPSVIMVRKPDFIVLRILAN